MRFFDLMDRDAADFGRLFAHVQHNSNYVVQACVPLDLPQGLALLFDGSGAHIRERMPGEDIYAAVPGGPGTDERKLEGPSWGIKGNGKGKRPRSKKH